MISSLKTVKIRLRCQLKRAVCSFPNLLSQIFEISCHVFRAFYFSCHAQAEMELKTESTEFQHKPEDKFSQKEFHCIELKIIS